MKRQRSDSSRLVYSTDSGRVRPQRGSESSSNSDSSGGDGIVRLWRQSKGRGGKTVTLIEGLPGSDAQLRERAKAFKRLCGVGGAVKDRSIEIQGDQRDRLAELLRAEGLKVKLAGG